ncbi:hypothetical protein GQ57_05585 [Burkholderia sp. MSh2]|nr:hypothetical protein GQ57_05585 [Burkholderia sp. MSh2]
MQGERRRARRPLIDSRGRNSPIEAKANATAIASIGPTPLAPRDAATLERTARSLRSGSIAASAATGAPAIFHLR